MKQMVGLSVHESGGGGYLVLADGWLGRRPPGPMPQLQGGVRHGLEVSRFPDFWPFWGGRAYSLRPPWHVPGGPWVWSLGLFSSIFFSTSINKKKKLIKKEYFRLSVSTQSLQVTPIQSWSLPQREGRPVGAHLW